MLCAWMCEWTGRKEQISQTVSIMLKLNKQFGAVCEEGVGPKF